MSVRLYLGGYQRIVDLQVLKSPWRGLRTPGREVFLGTYQFDTNLHVDHCTPHPVPREDQRGVVAVLDIIRSAPPDARMMGGKPGRGCPTSVR